MLTNVRSISIGVADQDRAVDFYCNLLGFEKTQDVPMGPDTRWIVVAPPGAATGLVLSKVEEAPGGFTGFIFDTDDIHVTYERLRDRGVRFTSEPQSQPWGQWTQFIDPDGNEFGVWAPPADAGASSGQG